MDDKDSIIVSIFLATVLIIVIAAFSISNVSLRQELTKERIDRCEKEWKQSKQWCTGQAQIDKW